MIIDITKGSHISTFPTKVASMMGQYSHVYNLVLTADTDNGTLAGRGEYVDYDQYEQADVANGFKGFIRGLASDGRYEIEVSELPSSEVLYVYNSAVSEYSQAEFQDETLFYNPEGDVAQGAVLCIGDVFNISKNGFTGTPEAGKEVTFASGKYVVA